MRGRMMWLALSVLVAGSSVKLPEANGRIVVGVSIGFINSLGKKN